MKQPSTQLSNVIASDSEAIQNCNSDVDCFGRELPRNDISGVLHKSFKLILGLGKSGVSTADFLASQHIPFVINDTRAEPPGLADIKKKHPNVLIHVGGLSQELLEAAEEIIVSPGLSLKEPLI